MNSHDTALAFARALAMSAAPALASVHIYAHDTEVLPDGSTHNTVEEIMLPAVFVRAQFEGLSGSATIGKGKLDVDVESQGDDETVATHSTRETAVRGVMADMGALTAAFAAMGTVELLGKPSLGENDPGVDSRAFKTPLTYKIGVRAL